MRTKWKNNKGGVRKPFNELSPKDKKVRISQRNWAINRYEKILLLMNKMGRKAFDI